jgi:hypothetical protein
MASVALGAAGAHHPPLPHADKIAGFAHWLGGVLDDVVMGGDGSWMAPFVGEAGELGGRHASVAVGEAAAPSLDSSTRISILQPDGQRHYNSLAVSRPLERQLRAGEYRPGRYVAFEVNDPKTAHRLGGAISGYFKLASSIRSGPAGFRRGPHLTRAGGPPSQVRIAPPLRHPVE